MPAEFSSFAGSRSGPQFGRRNPRRRPTTLANEGQYDNNILASFKVAPFFKAEDFKARRPLMGQCCQCMPLSRDDLVMQSAAEMGMRNILDVKPYLRSSSVLVNSFSEVVYTLRRPLFAPYPDLSMAVLTNRRVVEAVQKTVREQVSTADQAAMDKFAAVEKRAAKIMKSMKASVSTMFIKFTGWFLLKFLSIMLRGVLVHKGQMAILQKAAEKGLPMIYLPLHRSHLDYTLITFILWNYDIRAPYVAAGDNMNIPFFSILMRSLGGFFIRRRLDNGGTQKDIVYRAILNAYILEILKKGDSLEFFIEGGRSRTGRAIIPKGGLLSVVVDACREGIIPDAYIVPMVMSYDKMIEGTFCKEQMGQSKKRESFLGACKAIFNILCGDYGCVRADFAQPFSLREFLESAERFPKQDWKYGLAGMDSSASGLNFSQSALTLGCPAAPCGEGPDSTRLLVNSLAHHTLHTSVRTQAPMSPHCLSFLLLTKYRQGGTVCQLAQALDWLKEELVVHGQDVGFTGTSQDVVLYAHSLLGNQAIHSKSRDGEIFLQPNLAFPSVFELSYNANTITATFALESILTCAVVLEAGLTPGSWTAQFQASEEPSLSRDVILDTAQHIADLLHAEFVLVPPCCSVMNVLAVKLGDFISMEILNAEESQYEAMTDSLERQWAMRLSKSLAWDSEEDDEFTQGRPGQQEMLKVNIGAAHVREKIQFLHMVLAPILEAYLITAYYISQTLDFDMPEDDFLSKLGGFAQERARKKLVLHVESCGVVTLKNAVKGFQNLRILETYKEANLSMIALTQTLGVRERLSRYIEILKVSRC